MHSAAEPPSTSSIWLRSSRTSRGWARKKGIAKPVAPSGANHSVESHA